MDTTLQSKIYASRKAGFLLLPGRQNEKKVI